MAGWLIGRTGPRHLILTALALAAVVTPGCRCTLDVARPYAAPTPEAVIAALKARAGAVRTIRAETRMSYRTSEGRIKGTVRLMARRGGELRFDAVTPLDSPLMTLVSDGERFALIDAQQNRHFHGKASPCNIARLIQVVMEPDEVLAVLGGSTPIIAHTRATLAWDGKNAEEVLTLRGGPLTQAIRVDGRTKAWDLRRSVIRRNDKVLLDVTAADFRPLAGVRVPERIRVQQPSVGADLQVRFRRQEVNIDLPASAFVPPGPGGLQSELLTCETRVVAPDT